MSVTTRDLGERLGMNPLTVSRAMVTLEQHKLLTRTPTNGRRAKTFSYLAEVPDSSL
jgi:DNA-binding IclR family transcriptional regulator